MNGQFELELVSEPKLEKIRAIDVVPYCWGLRCTIGDSDKPLTNEIVVVSWSEDGERLRFMLESHNFMSALPDEELELVRLNPTPGEYLTRAGERHAQVVARRPTANTLARRKKLLADKAAIDAELKSLDLP